MAKMTPTQTTTIPTMPAVPSWNPWPEPALLPGLMTPVMVEIALLVDVVVLLVLEVVAGP
ncbi:hypothetical protein HDU91_000857, partial [Kappamyces sp. JEL0680]